MSCYNPILAVDFGCNTFTGKTRTFEGKHWIKILGQPKDRYPIEAYRAKYGKALMMLVPRIMLVLGKLELCVKLCIIKITVS